MTMHGLSIALCDDDPLFLDSLAHQIRELFQEQGKICDLSLYSSAKSLQEAIHDGKRFSLLVLDVMMEELNGMELARSLRMEGQHTPIIFISSNCEYALTGYEIDALRFLAKPVDTARLREALAAAEEKTRLRRLLIHNADGEHRVDVESILYAEVWERGVLLHLSGNRQIYSSVKIGALELMLTEADFFRCHQGYIVNLAHVSTIKTTDAHLPDGSCVPISRHKLAELRTRFTSYLSQ